MSIHEQLIACIQRADEAARAKEYKAVLVALSSATFKASLLRRDNLVAEEEECL